MDRDSIRIKYRLGLLFAYFNGAEAFHFHVGFRMNLKCFKLLLLSWPEWICFQQTTDFCKGKGNYKQSKWLVWVFNFNF